MGDHQQLKSYSETINRLVENPLAIVVKTSNFERARKNHVPSIRLIEQRRSTEESKSLMLFSNTQCYHSELKDPPGTALADRPFSQTMKLFLSQQYRINHYMAMPDVGATEVTLYGTSRVNTNFTYVTASFLRRLYNLIDIEALPSKDICVVTPYSGQV